LFHGNGDKPPGAQAVQDALAVLEGKALFDGEEHPVYLRLAGHEDKIYLDLGDETWQAVEVDKDGWRIVENPPVKFRRAKAMLALPDPVRGGSLTQLRRFV